MAHPKLPFCTPQDLYALFGRDNIVQWAFTTQNRESVLDDDTMLDTDPSLLNACNLATVQVVSRMFRTRYWQQCRDLADNADDLFTNEDIPLQIKHVATVMAAHQLFLSRFTNYSADDKSDRLKAYQDQVDTFFSDIERNKISLGEWTEKPDSNAPAVVASPDNIQGLKLPPHCNGINPGGLGTPYPDHTQNGIRQLGF